MTEVLESAMMRDLPGASADPGDVWSSIVAIPVPGAPPPIPLPADRVPPEAAALAAHLRG